MIWVTNLLIAVNLSMPIERKLAAIMFTNIAGYTALSAKDETKAIVKEYNKLNKDKN